MKNQIIVELRITGFPMHPDEVTSRIGIQPTETWLQGELVHPRAGIRHKKNGWELSSGVSREADFSEHIQALVSKIEPYVESLAEIGRQFYVELACVVYIYYDNGESTPAIHIERNAMNMFNQIGAEIDFDLYVRSE